MTANPMNARERDACAVCYVSDRGFLFPSLASALSLKDRLTGPDVDVFVFVLDIPAEEIAALNATFANRRIQVVAMEKRWRGQFDTTKFSTFNPVPEATLGRFFIEPLLPARYDRILYIDGDTLVDGDVAPLLDYALPAGAFAAVDDPLAFAAFGRGFLADFAKGYFPTLGVDPAKGYFNAGVFLADRSAWHTIAEEAFAFFRRHPELCQLHDQSALNVVVGDGRLRMSLRWNSMTIHRQWGSERVAKPMILHFSGSPKPWMGPYWPVAKYNKIYDPLRRRIPEIIAPSKILDGQKCLISSFNNLKIYCKLMTVNIDRVLLFRDLMSKYEKDCAI